MVRVLVCYFNKKPNNKKKNTFVKRYCEKIIVGVMYINDVWLVSRKGCVGKMKVFHL